MTVSPRWTVDSITEWSGSNWLYIDLICIYGHIHNMCQCDIYIYVQGAGIENNNNCSIEVTMLKFVVRTLTFSSKTTILLKYSVQKITKPLHRKFWLKWINSYAKVFWDLSYRPARDNFDLCILLQFHVHKRNRNCYGNFASPSLANEFLPGTWYILGPKIMKLSRFLINNYQSLNICHHACIICTVYVCNSETTRKSAEKSSFSAHITAATTFTVR